MLLCCSASENSGPQGMGSVAPPSYTLHWGDHEEGAPGLGLIGSRNWAECGQRSPLLFSFGLSGSLGKSSVAVPAFLAGPLVFLGVWDE